MEGLDKKNTQYMNRYQDTVGVAGIVTQSVMPPAAMTASRTSIDSSHDSLFLIQLLLMFLGKRNKIPPTW